MRRDPPARHPQRRTAAAAAARPRPRRHLRVRADRLQPHPHRQRASVRRLQPAQALPRARGLRGDAGHQRHRRQRQDLRRRARAGPSERRAGERDDGALPRRHRRARARPPRPRAAGARRRWGRSSPTSSALVESGHAYAATAMSTSACARTPTTAALSHRRLDDMDQGEDGSEGATERKEDPLDFALWKAHKEGEDTVWAVALGCGTARLAHRVLGDGRGVRSASASTSTAAARTCCSPTTRTRPPRPARRAARSWRGSGCTTA